MVFLNHECTKIYKIELYLLKCYFESHIIYKWRYYRKNIFNQLNIMVLYVNIIGLCHIVPILWKTYVMRHRYHVRLHNFHSKRIRDLLNRRIGREKEYNKIILFNNFINLFLRHPVNKTIFFYFIVIVNISNIKISRK